ncbi:MAG: hypothetical protein ACRDD1_19605 [Planctomycetia bacterium]
MHQAAHAAPAVAALNTVPIETIALGRRTLGENPELSDAERRAFVDPDPATWRELRFRMTKADDGGLDVHLLRPLDWTAAATPFGGASAFSGTVRTISGMLARSAAVEPSSRPARLMTVALIDAAITSPLND